jgi:SHS2 domain-containing protein
MNLTPPPNYAVFEHSGDLRIIARGADFLEALANASRGLVAQMVESGVIGEREERHLVVEGDDETAQAIAFLNEVLYLASTRHWLVARIRTLTQCSRKGCRQLEAIVIGEPIDHARHEFKYDIKAVTYHEFAIERHGDETTIQFVCDL